jgi:hypothetical protein
MSDSMIKVQLLPIIPRIATDQGEVKEDDGSPCARGAKTAQRSSKTAQGGSETAQSKES